MIQKAAIITQEFISPRITVVQQRNQQGLRQKNGGPSQGCLWMGAGFNTMDSMNYFKNTLTAYFGNKKKKLIETLGKVNKKVNT